MGEEDCDWRKEGDVEVTRVVHFLQIHEFNPAGDSLFDALEDMVSSQRVLLVLEQVGRENLVNEFLFEEQVEFRA